MAAIEKRNAKGKLIFRIDRQSKRGRYLVQRESSQFKYLEKINLVGFDKLPAGFYKDDGYGLTGGGQRLCREISKTYGKKIDLTLGSTGKPRLDTRPKTLRLLLPHADLTRINAEVRTLKRAGNEQIKHCLWGFMAETFRSQFSHLAKHTVPYTPGSLATILGKKGILKSLSPEDRARFEEAIPEYLQGISGTLRSGSKLQVIFKSLDAGRRVYLDKVVKEFKQKLKRAGLSENKWQEFLTQHILLLRSSYAEALPKTSVSLPGKFPDFLLLDPHGYLDIYEIKKPRTNLLKLDKSRNNYYWDVEMAKAISQVENYAHQVQRHADALVTNLRNTRNLAMNVVRPRGFIVAGTRAQLTSPKMQDDFRIMSESMKNIDVILYDDLLAGLEAFLQKLTKG